MAAAPSNEDDDSHMNHEHKEDDEDTDSEGHKNIGGSDHQTIIDTGSTFGSGSNSNSSDSDNSDDDSNSESTFHTSSSFLEEEEKRNAIFEKDKIIADVENFKFRYPSNVVTLRDITSEEESKKFEIDSDGKYLMVRIVNVKRPKATEKMSIFKGKTYSNPVNASYDRSFDFADISDTSFPMGRIIYDSPPEHSLKLVIQMNESFVGQDVLLVEPTWTGNMSADRMPIFKLGHTNSVVPLGYQVDLQDFQQAKYLDHAMKPSTMSETKYFCYTDCQIRVTDVEFKPSCCGKFCDRAGSSSECFCLRKVTDTGITMSCKLAFCPVTENRRFAVKENWYTQRNFMSYRFMSLFIGGEYTFDELSPNLVEIRRHIKSRVRRMNKSLVKITGWYRQGLKDANVDQSELGATSISKKNESTKRENKIANEELIPHVSNIEVNDKKLLKQKKFRYVQDHFYNYDPTS